MATDFSRPPTGATDEDGERGYVDVTAATDSHEAARAFVLGDGAEDVLGISEFRRAVPDALELRHLTVVLPPCDALPESVAVASILRSGEASGWWEFDISAATEEVDCDWRQEIARREAERTAEAKRRAVEDRGPWWWRLRCWAGDHALRIAAKLEPDDKASAYWFEDGNYVSQTVRGHGRVI